MPLRRADVAWNAGVAAAYFLAAKLGLTLATVGVTVTLVWPPSGVAVAAMLLLGRQVWPGVAIGAFIANATTDAPIAVAWFTAVGNPLEALVAASLLRRMSDFDSSLERTRDVLALTILGAIVAPMVGATVGVAGLVLTGTLAASGIAAAWFTWWGGDAMGILLVTPLILAWVSRPGRGASTARILEGTVLVVITGIAGFLVFGGLLPGRATEPLVYVALPLLIWAAFSFEVRGAATGSAVIAALAVWSTSRGSGPFARETLGLSLVHLGAFMGVATLTSLVLAAIVRERRRADSERAASLVRERAARRDAELASSAKSDFLAVMSHELRTPLNAIIGYVSLLADGITGPLNDQQVAQLGRVKGSATHLLALIEQILSLSRIEAGHDDIRVEQVDARTVVRDATTLVEPLMTAKGLALHVDLPPEPNELATDVTKVRQILLNLLTNAGKFTERGSVRCELRAEEEMFVIDVTDTGRGISSEDLPHVFESFWQASAGDHERPEGVGLGLSVSRRLARILGGEITVASVLGQGSTFSVRLPRRTPNDNGRDPGARQAPF